MTKILKIKPIMTVEESDALSASMLTQDACKLLITYDADVFDAKTGACIAKFRKGLIPDNVQQDAFEALLSAASPSQNRGISGGAGGGAGKDKDRRIKVDGTVTKTQEAPMVNSGIVGYFDRNVRFPNCRLTAFNKQHLDKFKKAWPIFKVVDNLYKKLMPVEYKRQKSMADKTAPEFVINDTVFTTVTVNKNWQTAVHKDVGDFKGGFGNLVALRKGFFKGGHFVVVRWGVGFDLQNGDILLVDVHQWHGNTPIVAEKGAVRLSLVHYYREKMFECGTLKEELDRAKNRKKGQPLYDQD